jgi:hypothetical protein
MQIVVDLDTTDEEELRAVTDAFQAMLLLQPTNFFIREIVTND